MPREEFGACTSYLSIAAYRSDAHHLLANVMVSPITGRRSSARSGNDRAPKRLARMPKQSRIPGRGLSKVYHTQRAGATRPGAANVGCTDVPPVATQTANSSQWLHYLTTQHTNFS